MSAKGKPKSKPAADGPPVPAGDVLTLAEAATFLRVPTETLRADVIGGRVPGRLVGNEWRFARSALVAWLSQPEPPIAKPARTGRELVEHLKRINAESPFRETEEEAEAFLAKIYAARKADPVGGDR
jgi:excisionase family DNA binding protein